MKILVTGYKGFIGKNFFSFLKKKKIKVFGYDYKYNKKFPIIKNYDWVIHLGAISSTTETNIKKIMRQNFFFSKKILEECIKYNVNLQYASSASVYDEQLGFKESSKCKPKSPYSLSKFLFDEHVKDLNCKIIIQGFRYFNVFGSNENNKYDQASPVYKFVKQAKKDKIINLFYNSSNYKRDFVFVGDICKIQTQMLKSKESGLFNIGRGKAISFEDIAKAVAKRFNCRINYIKMPLKIKKHYQKYTKANISKINKIVKIKWCDPIKYIEQNENFTI